MVESSNTQVSSISAPGVRGTARDAVASFLKFTVDSPDLKQAKLHLTKRSVKSGMMKTSPVPAGSTYTLGAEEADELGWRILVNMKSPAPAGGATHEMTLPLVVVEEDGEWKIDLPATAKRAFGTTMDAVGTALGAIGKAMTSAMTGVLSYGLGGDAGGDEPSRMTEAAAAPRGRKVKMKSKKKAAPSKKKPTATKAKKALKAPAKKKAVVKKAVKKSPVAKKSTKKKRR